MTPFAQLDFTELTPTRLWEALDPPTRTLAARALYDRDLDDRSSRVEADMAIAAAMRFRDRTVRTLPLNKRADYLVKVVKANDSLASSLLTALHFVHRRPLLEAFLDALGIPQQDGVIDADEEFEPPDDDRLAAAVDRIAPQFPADQLRLYLATLVALDPENWQGLTAVLVRDSS